MDLKNAGLIIFALVALAAVMGFIYTMGGPEKTPTGQLSGEQKSATSWYKVMDDGEEVCAVRVRCPLGQPAKFIGYNAATDMFGCVCYNGFVAWRSRIYIYG